MPCAARSCCSTLLQRALLQKDTGQAQEAQARSEKADLALGGFSASRPGRTGSHGGRSGSPRGCAVLAGMLVVWAQSRGPVPATPTPCSLPIEHHKDVGNGSEPYLPHPQFQPLKQTLS